MEGLFSNKYKEITELGGLKLKIDNRWVCYVYKESLGWKGEGFILFDNFGEKYYITKDIINNTMSVDKGNIIDNSVTLKPKLYMLNPLPDIAIDVLETCSETIAIETLNRIADVIKKRRNY